MKKYIFALTISLLYLSSLFAQLEQGASACADGIDNDGDGLIDCEDSDCSGPQVSGCDICPDGISYADVVIQYISGCPVPDPEPEGALGVGDWVGTGIDGPEIVYLGQGGSIKLGFTNNVLTNSGSAAPDIFVFEVGPLVEASNIGLRPEDAATEVELIANGVPDIDGDGFFEFGTISGNTASIDIDAVIPGYAGGALRFNAVEIVDVDDSPCSGGTPGADIDAVCALTSLPAPDCEGIQGGTAVIDNCGDCLQPNDPAFNLACGDCNGIANGTAIIDSCGVCNEPASPDFNATCIDCNGVLFGTAIVDECGICNEPSSPDFNASCVDCAGTPNGLAVIDICGECLEPSAPNYNLSCSDLNVLFRPNAFSPNGDGINDEFRIYAPEGTTPGLVRYRIFDRWGGLVYELKNLSISADTPWWDGSFNGQPMKPGVYIYFVEVEFESGLVKRYDGQLVLL